MACIGLLVLTMVFFIQTILGNEEEGLQLLDNMGCFCPGDFLAYECTIFGEPGGVTVWTGTVSVFNCTNREISLYHGDYESTEGAYGECGDITGQSIRFDANSMDGNNINTGYYVSQLTINISSDADGMTIECLYDDGTVSRLVGQNMIPATIGPFPPPDILYISSVDFVTRRVTFTWSPVGPDCPAIHYNILASNCGSCPTTTNHTTVTCTEVFTNGNACTFAIQTVVCGNITNQKSKQILINTNVKYSTNTLDMLNFEYDTIRVYIISISSLATALIISVVVSTTVIIFLIRSKAKVKAALDQKLTNQAGRSSHSMYEDITGPTHSITAFTTQDNVAYHHTQSINTEATTKTQ